mmetsp:Transcript_75126/g.220164  ORF Transcript_75126/g.220164 Transcript_75126/m.220164 type:complete len:399 (-) Transcript_75126:93-1289(-)
MGAALRPPLGVTAAMAAHSAAHSAESSVIWEDRVRWALIFRQEVLNMVVGPPPLPPSQDLRCVCGGSFQADLPFCGNCGRHVTAVKALDDCAAASSTAGSRCACGSTIAAGARFCEGCGRRAPPQDPPSQRGASCHSCGGPLRPGAPFCGGCGRRALSATEAPLPPASAKPPVRAALGTIPAVASGGPGRPGGPGGSRRQSSSPACSPVAAVAAARLKEPNPAEPPPRAVIAKPAPPKEELMQAAGASTADTACQTRADGASCCGSAGAEAAAPAGELEASASRHRSPSAPGPALVLRLSSGRTPLPSAPEAAAAPAGPPSAEGEEGPWPSQALHDGSPHAAGARRGAREPSAPAEGSSRGAEATPELGDSFNMDLAMAIARSLEDEVSRPAQDAPDP